MATQGAAGSAMRDRPAPRFPGLSEEEAAERVARGLSNRTAGASSRTIADILRANLLTRFNALLGSLLLVILIVGPLQDAVFGLILVLNAVIGVAQELRAKRTLDRLAILSAPRAMVIRAGVVKPLAVAEVVQDDLLQVSAGDEIVVDGLLVMAKGIEVSEALLTGEARPIAKSDGEEVLAGSFVAAGEGIYRATRVGGATYAGRLTVEARRFQLVHSELMRGINRILAVVAWLIAPTAILLIYSQLRANPSLQDAARGAVAGVITLVPEGLVLLTSASLALAAIRLGRRKVLVQQLPAVELLARTDIVCFDKTGTLTEPDPAVETVDVLDPGVDWRAGLGAIARAERRPNPAMSAIAAYAEPVDWVVEETVAFASDRKWSAARFAGRGWWVIGAPDVLVPGSSLVASDRRALVLARAGEVSQAGGIEAVRPVATVILAESIKPDAAGTLKELAAHGCNFKFISGDHPDVVSRVAGEVGIAAGLAVDARTLPAAGTSALGDVAEQATVFGRVTPQQKRDLVRALRSRGHTVAMVGDGVNDILALKEADLGIGLGSGSSAARAVAACVLVDGSFAGLPAVLREGRRVIGNIERLASLFFTKTVYAFALAVAVGIALFPFPFLPRQLTLVSAFTIGIPSAVLTLSASFTPSGGRFLRRVAGFALPVGAVAAAATFLAYALALSEPGVSIREERTVATLVMAAIGVWVLARLTSPLTQARRVLVVTMALGIAVTVAVPLTRTFFDLDFPQAIVVFAAIGMIATAVAVLEGGYQARRWMAGRRRSRG